MKSLQYFGPKDLRFVETEKPVIGDSDVLLQVKKVGICGTDLHIYNGGMHVPTPLTIGHEFVGDVAQIGNKVTHVKPGNKAVAEHVIGCGACTYCREGRRNLCIKPTVIGLHKPGALAEYIAIPSDLVYKLPETLSYDAGVLVEPLSIAVYAVRKVGINVGDLVGVVGQGPIGLFVDQVAKVDGGVVYGFDILDERLRYAKKRELITEGINANDTSYLDTYKKVSQSDGADTVFECVGQESTANMSLELARPGGKVVILGVFEHDVLVNMMHVVKKELQVFGSWTCIYAFEPTIRLLESGNINIGGLITHRYPFEKTVQAFEDSLAYTDNRIKTVIEL